MLARAGKARKLVEVLPDTACDAVAISVVSLPTRHILPKVRAFTDHLRRALAPDGAAKRRATR
jgi:DNA-binding transcriptional LysR family regulator